MTKTTNIPHVSKALVWWKTTRLAGPRFSMSGECAVTIERHKSHLIVTKRLLTVNEAVLYLRRRR